MEWPVLAWVAATALATVFAAAPGESLDKMRKLLLFGMMWWAPAVVAGGWKLGRLYTGLLFAAGTTSLYGVLVFFMQGGPELAVRIEGFHGFYLTHSAMLLLCTFPAVLFTVCPTIQPAHRWGAGLAAASILAAEIHKRVAVEAASTFGWERLTGVGGTVIGMDSFGASAPAEVIAEQFGFTTEAIETELRRLLEA